MTIKYENVKDFLLKSCGLEFKIDGYVVQKISNKTDLLSDMSEIILEIYSYCDNIDSSVLHVIWSFENNFISDARLKKMEAFNFGGEGGGGCQIVTNKILRGVSDESYVYSIVGGEKSVITKVISSGLSYYYVIVSGEEVFSRIVAAADKIDISNIILSSDVVCFIRPTYDEDPSVIVARNISMADKR